MVQEHLDRTAPVGDGVGHQLADDQQGRRYAGRGPGGMQEGQSPQARCIAAGGLGWERPTTARVSPNTPWCVHRSGRYVPVWLTGLTSGPLLGAPCSAASSAPHGAPGLGPPDRDPSGRWARTRRTRAPSRCVMPASRNDANFRRGRGHSRRRVTSRWHRPPPRWGRSWRGRRPVRPRPAGPGSLVQRLSGSGGGGTASSPAGLTSRWRREGRPPRCPWRGHRGRLLPARPPLSAARPAVVLRRPPVR